MVRAAATVAGLMDAATSPVPIVAARGPAAMPPGAAGGTAVRST
jgi:hypothetical protein